MDQKLLKVYLYSIKICSKKDIPEKLLRDKIKFKFNDYSESNIEFTINILKKENYINDKRFTENFINWRKNYMPRGKSLIYKELIQKKVSSEIINQVINSLITDEDEKNMCLIIAQKKYLTLENIEIPNQNKKEKLLKFLLNKQFSYEVIMNSINKIL
jgi:regulatory protein